MRIFDLYHHPPSTNAYGSYNGLYLYWYLYFGYNNCAKDLLRYQEDQAAAFQETQGDILIIFIFNRCPITLRVLKL